MRSLFPYTHKTHTHTSMYTYMPVQVEITLQQALAGCHLEFPSLETNRPVTLALYDSVRMQHSVAVHGAVMHALQPDPFSPCAKLTCVPCVCVVCAHEQIIVDGEEHLVPHRGMPVPQDDGRLLYGDMRVRVRLRTLHRYVVVYTQQCRFITTCKRPQAHVVDCTLYVCTCTRTEP